MLKDTYDCIWYLARLNKDYHCLNRRWLAAFLDEVGPGFFSDLDMLEVGNPGNAVGDPPYLRRPLTPDEQVPGSAAWLFSGRFQVVFRARSTAPLGEPGVSWVGGRTSRTRCEDVLSGLGPCQCTDLFYEVHRSHRWKVLRNHRSGVPWHPLS